MSKPVLEQVRKATQANTASLWLVRMNGNIVGMLERFKGTRTEVHPWKAYRGYGPSAKYIGGFYEDGSVRDDGMTLFGGKAAAIDAIIS
jgi:hypothetical protein